MNPISPTLEVNVAAHFGGRHVCIENVIKLICDTKLLDLLSVGFSKMN